MALFDQGLVPFEEPFPNMRVGGFVRLAGVKMGKSKRNVVNPDDLVSAHGGDVTRIALLFSGRWEADHDYESNGTAGAERFARRVWNVICNPEAGVGRTDVPAPSKPPPSPTEVGRQIERLALNVAIARLMEFVGHLERSGATDEDRRTLALLLAPFAPYLAEELWSEIGGKYSVHQQPWPE